LVAFVQGDVSVNGKAARQGASLAQGDKVRVGEGRVTLILDRDRVVHLGSDTSLVVEQLKVAEAVDLKLEYGAVRNLIKSRSGSTRSFRVRTPSAVMGVRGTQFVAELPRSGASTGEGLRVATLEGQVSLWSGAGSDAAQGTQGQQGLKGLPATPEVIVKAGQVVTASGLKPISESAAREVRAATQTAARPVGAPPAPMGPPPPPVAPGFGGAPPATSGSQGILPSLKLDLTVQ